MVNRNPTTGVATIAINARGTQKRGLARDAATKNTNAQKASTEITAVMRPIRPTQKIGLGHEPLPNITNQSEFRSRT